MGWELFGIELRCEMAECAHISDDERLNRLIDFEDCAYRYREKAGLRKNEDEFVW